MAMNQLDDKTLRRICTYLSPQDARSLSQTDKRRRETMCLSFLLVHDMSVSFRFRPSINARSWDRRVKCVMRVPNSLAHRTHSIVVRLDKVRMNDNNNTIKFFLMRHSPDSVSFGSGHVEATSWTPAKFVVVPKRDQVYYIWCTEQGGNNAPAQQQQQQQQQQEQQQQQQQPGNVAGANRPLDVNRNNNNPLVDRDPILNLANRHPGDRENGVQPAVVHPIRQQRAARGNGNVDDDGNDNDDDNVVVQANARNDYFPRVPSARLILERPISISCQTHAVIFDSPQQQLSLVYSKIQTRCGSLQNGGLFFARMLQSIATSLSFQQRFRRTLDPGLLRALESMGLAETDVKPLVEIATWAVEDLSMECHPAPPDDGGPADPLQIGNHHDGDAENDLEARAIMRRFPRHPAEMRELMRRHRRRLFGLHR